MIQNVFQNADWRLFFIQYWLPRLRHSANDIVFTETWLQKTYRFSLICGDPLALLASVLEDRAENVITLGQGSPPYPVYLLPIVEASWTSAAQAPKILYNQASLSCNQSEILFLGHPVSPWVPLQFTVLYKSASPWLTYCSKCLKVMSSYQKRVVQVCHSHLSLSHRCTINGPFDLVECFTFSILITALFWTASLKYLRNFAKSQSWLNAEHSEWLCSLEEEFLKVSILHLIPVFTKRTIFLYWLFSFAIDCHKVLTSAQVNIGEHMMGITMGC